MKPKLLSFVLVTSSLGFTAFAFSQVPLAGQAPTRRSPPALRSPGYRHYAARARNGSTQKSTTPPAAIDGGALWDPMGTGTRGLDNGLDGGEAGAGTSGDQSTNPHR